MQTSLILSPFVREETPFTPTPKKETQTALPNITKETAKRMFSFAGEQALRPKISLGAGIASISYLGSKPLDGHSIQAEGEELNRLDQLVQDWSMDDVQNDSKISDPVRISSSEEQFTFGSEEKLVECLKGNSHPYLAEKKVLGRVAKEFANTIQTSESIERGVNSTMIDVITDARLPAHAAVVTAISLTANIKKCGLNDSLN